jgi:hypothetical protein
VLLPRKITVATAFFRAGEFGHVVIGVLVTKEMQIIIHCSGCRDKRRMGGPFDVLALTPCVLGSLSMPG